MPVVYEPRSLMRTHCKRTCAHIAILKLESFELWTVSRDESQELFPSCFRATVKTRRRCDCRLVLDKLWAELSFYTPQASSAPVQTLGGLIVINVSLGNNALFDRSFALEPVMSL